MHKNMATLHSESKKNKDDNVPLFNFFHGNRFKIDFV